VPTIDPDRYFNGGHASLCPPYDLVQSFLNTIDAIQPVISAMNAVTSP
jgi:hypothetical protein